MKPSVFMNRVGLKKYVVPTSPRMLAAMLTSTTNKTTPHNAAGKDRLGKAAVQSDPERLKQAIQSLSTHEQNPDSEFSRMTIKTTKPVTKSNAQKQKDYRARKKSRDLNVGPDEQIYDPWGGIFDISPGLYTKVRDDEAKQHIGALLNMKPQQNPSLKKESTLNKRSAGVKAATEQLSDAYSHLSSGFSIQFNSLDENGVEHIRNNLGKLLNKFITGINYSDKWVAVYQFGDQSSKIRPVDEITSAQLYHQLFDEGFIDPGTVEYLDPFESGGQFIPYQISSLNSIKFVNLKHHNLNGTALGSVMKKLSPFTKKALQQNDQELSPAHLTKIENALARKTRNTRREGRFWPYRLTIPYINLERQMIFAAINERTVKIIEGDNCLIYACKMAGIDDAKLNHMRNIIKIRSFSLAKLSIIAEECDLTFKVVDGSSSKSFTIGGSHGSPPLELLLYESHYMINERIRVSPFFIQHASDIMKSHHTRWWTPDEKRLTSGQKPSGEYIKGTKQSHKLISILKSIFKVGGFKEIRYGDYMTFSSTLYASKLRSMIDLSYEPKYCCRLKIGPQTKISPESRRNECDEVPL